MIRCCANSSAAARTRRTLGALVAVLVAAVVHAGVAHAIPPLAGVVTHVEQSVFLTVKLDTGEIERVRVIGIDPLPIRHPKMPEGVYREDADARVRELVLDRRVGLNLDDANAAFGHRDREGRLLVHVIVDGGDYLAFLLIRDGYAYHRTEDAFDPAIEAVFETAQTEAQAAKRGVWAVEPAQKDQYPSPGPTAAEVAAAVIGALIVIALVLGPGVLEFIAKKESGRDSLAMVP
ncbi:MAG: thermonuclease family protein [Deltaproteobacteria bacterium]|nr:thermonuclease family protein [Deltaproteobacteria bacterium]